MSFWLLNHPSHRPALLNSVDSVSYGDLQALVNEFNACLTCFLGKSLGVILSTNTIGSLVGYLGALQTGHAVLLLDSNLNKTLLEDLIKRYQPEWIWGPVGVELESFTDHIYTLNNYKLILSTERSTETLLVYEQLALLLPTSGSTGSPKVVRLSYENLMSNARSIATYLKLDHTERPITTLPIHYSYGLSVINSHLFVGAAVLLTDEEILSKRFWYFFEDKKATSFSGVPFHYQTLYRLRFPQKEFLNLRYFTQAGGHLDEKLVQYFCKICDQRHWCFFVMYGQTEATARISYVPYEKLAQKPNSIGLSIPNGNLNIDPNSGELIYCGKNVMLGYAESRTDLAKTDELKSVLKTGDLAKQDEEGFFYIIGRTKRFLKLFGYRINLDEVERLLENEANIQATCFGNDNLLTVAIENQQNVNIVRQFIMEKLKLHPTAFKVCPVEKIPKLSSGKTDYELLSKSTVQS